MRSQKWFHYFFDLNKRGSPLFWTRKCRLARKMYQFVHDFHLKNMNLYFFRICFIGYRNCKKPIGSTVTGAALNIIYRNTVLRKWWFLYSRFKINGPQTRMVYSFNEITLAWIVIYAQTKQTIYKGVCFCF